MQRMLSEIRALADINETTPMEDVARYYINEMNWRILPLKHGDKLPFESGWQNKKYDPSFWQTHPNAGVGMVTYDSRMMAVDFDNESDSYLALNAIKPILARAIGVDEKDYVPFWERKDSTWMPSGKENHNKVWFVLPEGMAQPKHHTLVWPRVIPDCANPGKMKIKNETVLELRCIDKRYFEALAPSLHPDGTYYSWLGPNPILAVPDLLEFWENFESVYEERMARINPDYKRTKELKEAEHVFNKNIDDTDDSILEYLNEWSRKQDLIGMLKRYLGCIETASGELISPHSSSGKPGVKILPDGWHFIMYHTSDPYYSDENNPRCAYDILKREVHHGDGHAATIQVLTELGVMKDKDEWFAEKRAEEVRLHTAEHGELSEAIHQYLVDEGITQLGKVTLEYPKLMLYAPIKKYFAAKKPLSEFNELCLDELRGISGKTQDVEYYDVLLKGFPESAKRCGMMYDTDVPKGSLVNLNIQVTDRPPEFDEYIQARFECKHEGCHWKSRPFPTNGEKPRVPPGLTCQFCKKHTDGFRLYENGCVTRKVRWLTVQDALPEGGEQPAKFRIRVAGSLVDKLTAGSVALVTVQINAEMDGDATGHRFGDVYYIETTGRDRDIVISPEDEEEIKKLAARPDIYQLLGDSIKPSIYGLDDVKLGLVLAMFGGVTGKANTNTHIRGEINTALAGNPGMAKTQLIKAVVDIVPGGIYTSGGSTSGPGLTGSATFDERAKQWKLTAGAMSLANDSVCGLDELDKLSASDIGKAHEAMTEGEIHFNKADIRAVLLARCTVFAALNPIDSFFHLEQDILKQINLPPSFLDRFDLIFVLADDTTAEEDAIIANRMFDAADMVCTGEELKGYISISLYRKYIVMAKKLMPTLSPEARTYLITKLRFYKEERNCTFTPRQMDALRRLAQAAARVKLRNVVTLEDAKLAVYIYIAALKTVKRYLMKYNDDDIRDCNMSLGSGAPEPKDVQIEDYLHELLKDASWSMDNVYERFAEVFPDIKRHEIRNRAYELRDASKLDIVFEPGVGEVLTWKKEWNAQEASCPEPKHQQPIDAALYTQLSDGEWKKLRDVFDTFSVADQMAVNFRIPDLIDEGKIERKFVEGKNEGEYIRLVCSMNSDGCPLNTQEY